MRHELQLVLASLVVSAVATSASPRGAAEAPTLLPFERVREIAEVSDVTVRDGSIRGAVVNRSDAPIEDVAVRVQHLWLWGDEYEPGPADEDPSYTRLHRLDGAIAPGESRSFSFEHGQEEAPDDGRFLVLVSVGELERDAESSSARGE